MSDFCLSGGSLAPVSRGSHASTVKVKSLFLAKRPRTPAAGPAASLTKITLRGNALAKKTKIGLTRQRAPSEKTELGAIDRAGAVDVETREL